MMKVNDIIIEFAVRGPRERNWQAARANILDFMDGLELDNVSYLVDRATEVKDNPDESELRFVLRFWSLERTRDVNYITMDIRRKVVLMELRLEHLTYERIAWGILEDGRVLWEGADDWQTK